MEIICKSITKLPLALAKGIMKRKKETAMRYPFHKWNGNRNYL